jgi:hypothetical protein
MKDIGDIMAAVGSPPTMSSSLPQQQQSTLQERGFHELQQ